MAEIDDRAFNAMNTIDPDRNIGGGAIDYSEYEMDMSPKQQRKFIRENVELFKGLYNVDPLADKEKLPFKQWLKALNPERIRLLSEDYEDTQAPRDDTVIISKDIMKQADRHWGGKQGFDEIRNMVLGDFGSRQGY